MNKKSILGIIAVMLVGGIAIYFYLGGLNKVEVKVESISDYNLVGFHFQGEGDDKTLREGWEEAKELVQSGRLDGTVTVLNYKDSTLEDGHVKVFMGVRLNAGTSDLPENYERITIPAKRTVRAVINAHNSVMPNSQTVEKRLLEKADELRLELQDFTIEQYLSEQELWIDMPVRQ